MDPLSLVGAGIGAVGNIFGAGINALGSNYAAKQNYKYSMKMAQWQNETNIQNWNMQNEYNSPLAQMQRLEDAGLNPNLVYGNGSVGNSANAPASASVPQSSFFHNPYSQFPSAIQGMMDAALKAAQIDKITQETSNLAESQRLTQFDQRLRELQAIGQQYSNSKNETEAELWRDMWDHKMMLMFSNSELNDARRFDLDSQRNFRDGVQTDEANSRIGLNKSSMARNISEIGLNEYRKELMQSQAYEAMTRAGVNVETQKKIVQEVVNLKEDENIKKTTNHGKQINNAIDEILLRNGVNLRSGGKSELVNKLIWLKESQEPDKYFPYLDRNNYGTLYFR